MTAQSGGKKSARVGLATLLPPPDMSTTRGRKLAAQLQELTPEPIDWTVCEVFATRDRARQVVAALPDGVVVLDCVGVEVMSPPFVDELLALRPDVDLVNANEDVTTCWEMVVERRS